MFRKYQKFLQGIELVSVLKIQKLLKLIQKKKKAKSLYAQKMFSCNISYDSRENPRHNLNIGNN